MPRKALSKRVRVARARCRVPHGDRRQTFAPVASTVPTEAGPTNRRGLATPGKLARRRRARSCGEHRFRRERLGRACRVARPARLGGVLDQVHVANEVERFVAVPKTSCLGCRRAPAAAFHGCDSRRIDSRVAEDEPALTHALQQARRQRRQQLGVAMEPIGHRAARDSLPSRGRLATLSGDRQG